MEENYIFNYLKDLQRKWEKDIHVQIYLIWEIFI